MVCGMNRMSGDGLVEEHIKLKENSLFLKAKESSSV